MLRNKPERALASIVEARPFREFSPWWKMGYDFIHFMSMAIVSQWTELDGTKGGLEKIQNYLVEYLKLVYDQGSHPDLLKKFIKRDFSSPFYSGEFDALSYAFYRLAFETIAEKYIKFNPVIVQERRKFTRNVGKVFFSAVHKHLQLDLPSALKTQEQFQSFQKNISSIGEFLMEQGYLRDWCEFTFSVDVTQANQHVYQDTDDFLNNLNSKGRGYALYIMGYPAIFPSAVYLFQMFGEAQHHSSRMIEELFEKVGCIAHETNNFDPSNFPSDRVVELWSVSCIS